MSAQKPSFIPSGGMAGPGLSKATSALQSGISNLVTNSSKYLNHFFPPQKRQQWKQWLTKFVTERPYLASFLLSQIAISGLPLLLFGLMTVTVFIFALLAGVLVGVLGALLFVVGVVGFALLIFLPILFFTTGAAVFIWLWGVGTYFIIKWFNEKDIPGVHADIRGGLVKPNGFGNLPSMNGNPVGGQNQNPALYRPQQGQRPPPKLEKQQQQGGNAASGIGADQVPPRKPVSRTPSPDQPPNMTGPTEDPSDTQNGQGQQRKPVPSRAPSPNPPTNATNAAGDQSNGDQNHLQPRQPVARPFPPIQVPEL